MNVLSNTAGAARLQCRWPSSPCFPLEHSSQHAGRSSRGRGWTGPSTTVSDGPAPPPTPRGVRLRRQASDQAVNPWCMVSPAAGPGSRDRRLQAGLLPWTRRSDGRRPPRASPLYYRIFARLRLRVDVCHRKLSERQNLSQGACRKGSEKSGATAREPESERHESRQGRAPWWRTCDVTATDAMLADGPGVQVTAAEKEGACIAEEHLREERSVYGVQCVEACVRRVCTAR